MAKDKGFIFKEVSAKEGTNINDLFYVEIFDEISKKFGLAEPEEDIKNNYATNNNKNDINVNQGKLNLNDKSNKKNKKKKCCK